MLWISVYTIVTSNQLKMSLPEKKRDKQYCRIKFEYNVKGYQKLTLITAILGLVVLVPIVVGYVYFNSLIGFPILGLFLGGILLHVFVLLLVNAAGLYVAFRIKNTKAVGILLVVCGVIILAAATYFGIPSFVLFCVAGVLALKEKQSFSTVIRNK
jgi:uncharacterized membrane protein